MPTKKKKRNQISSDLLDLMFKHRGQGIDQFKRDELILERPNTYPKLLKYIKKIKMEPQIVHSIIVDFLFKSKNSRQNFLKNYVLKDIELNNIEVKRFLTSIKKYGDETVLDRKDPDGALRAFEATTLYRAPLDRKRVSGNAARLKTFRADLTTIRKAAGQNRKRSKNMYLD